MAANVIPFPKRSEAKLSEIEQLIRKWLAEITSDSDTTEYITGRMMTFVDNYATKSFEPTFNLPVPPNFSCQESEALLVAIQKGVADTAQEVQEMVNRIIIERFLLEVEIYESRTCQKLGPHGCG